MITVDQAIFLCEWKSFKLDREKKNTLMKGVVTERQTLVNLMKILTYSCETWIVTYSKILFTFETTFINCLNFRDNTQQREQTLESFDNPQSLVSQTDEYFSDQM